MGKVSFEQLHENSSRRLFATESPASSRRAADPVGAKRIPVGVDGFALVDARDFPRLNAISWYLHSGYARHDDYSEYPRRRVILLHREVLRVGRSVLIGFLNGNRLDCRSRNLYVRGPFPLTIEAAAEAPSGLWTLSTQEASS